MESKELLSRIDDNNLQLEDQRQYSRIELEREIECPRCYDTMSLCSDFDSLYYFCGGCDFCLYTIKKTSNE
jgi:hypothetical protein